MGRSVPHASVFCGSDLGPAAAEEILAVPNREDRLCMYQ